MYTGVLPLKGTANDSIRLAQLLTYQLRFFSTPPSIFYGATVVHEPANSELVDLTWFKEYQPQARFIDAKLFTSVQLCNYDNGGVDGELHQFRPAHQILASILKFAFLTPPHPGGLTLGACQRRLYEACWEK